MLRVLFKKLKSQRTTCVQLQEYLGSRPRLIYSTVQFQGLPLLGMYQHQVMGLRSFLANKVIPTATYSGNLIKHSSVCDCCFYIVNLQKINIF